MESLAQKMFGDVFGGIKSAVDKASEAISSPEEEDIEAAEPVKGDAMVSDIDERARTGDITFADFLTMSSAFSEMGGRNIPGMPTLTPAQLAETKEKFERHESIVDVMLDEERSDPQLLLEDMKGGGSKPGPRIQRLATASNQPETEVGLFLMQFEAMRESTKRISEGEDPDTVNESMSAPPGSNRQARRAAKKRKKTKM
jgi:signal recognition particle GTPase